MYPFASKLIEKIPVKAGAIITTLLLVFMIFDSFMSIAATYRWQQRMDGILATNYFEDYLDRSFNDEKMQFLFPILVAMDLAPKT